MPFINPVTVGVATRAAGALGGLWGKRSKSACRVVDTADLDGFRAGKVAPWVLDDRVQDIHDALGIYPVAGFGTGAPPTGGITGGPFVGTPITLGLTVADLADMHVSRFVPLCQQIEGGSSNYTDDPQSGPGLAVYNAAREEFKARLRSGRVSFKNLPRGGNGGDMPATGSGSSSSSPTTPSSPLMAGGGLLWGALALVAFFTLKKG